jgi:class 3 adenylate cyclase
MTTAARSSRSIEARALALILAIDRVRDSAPDEREMASAIVTTLADAVEAELCLLCLRDDDTDELSVRALIDRAGAYDDGQTEEALRQLAQRAADARGAEFLRTDLVLNDRAHSYCIAGPLRVGDDSLGALLLLNAERPFDSGEITLVQDAVIQIDYAMQHNRTLRELRSRQRELETIYRIDRVRDAEPPFQELLDAVLAEVVGAVETETGFLMLYDRVGNELELRAVTGGNLFGAEASAHLIRAVSDEAVQTGKIVNATYTAGPIRAMLGMPLVLRDKLIGVLGVANPTGRPAFSRSDIQMLHAIASQMNTAIFESLQIQRLRDAFGLCVGPQVMQRLLTIADRDLLSGERRVVSTLFSDIRGFTNMAEQIAPEQLQAVLNDHLSALTELVLAYEGTLDKYIGDSVMCFFNAPENQPDHALRAVRLALEMQNAQRKLIARWRGRLPLPPIGVGISTGETMMGNFGSHRRLEYTAIGRDVNLAARLCGAAEGDQILVSQGTYALVGPYVLADPLPPIRLKGIEGNVYSWSIKELR